MTSPSDTAEALDAIREALSIAASWATKRPDRENGRTKVKAGLDAARRLRTDIAALNAEVERWGNAYNLAHAQAMENGSRAQSAEASLAEAREALDALITDVENKWGDPHTLRHAKAALQSQGNPHER